MIFSQANFQEIAEEDGAKRGLDHIGSSLLKRRALHHIGSSLLEKRLMNSEALQTLGDQDGSMEERRRREEQSVNPHIKYIMGIYRKQRYV